MPSPSERRKKTGDVDVEGDLAERVRQLEEENRQLSRQQELLKSIRARLDSVPERIMMINRVSQEINTLDLEKIAEVATRKIPELIAATHCSLYLYDYALDELVLKAHNHPGDLTQRIPVKHHPDTVMVFALSQKRTLHITDFGDFERAHAVKFERTFASKYPPSCVCVPLRTGQYIVGILNLAGKRDGAPFDSASDVPVIEQLAQMLAMAIRNCNLVKELQDQARTDGLTRLFNYRAFHEGLRAEMHRSVRYSRPLGLVMLDMDGFKQINDKFGHQAGDYALTELSQIIRGILRREDMAARYGGDEIAIVLPETSEAGCRAVVQRLQAAVREHKFVFEGRPLTITLSMGVAFFRPEMTITDFVGAADEALYKAKQAGRNRYVVAGEG